VDRHRDRHELDAVGKSHHAEIEPPCARIHVGADETEKQTEHDHRDRFDERSVRQNDGCNQAAHHQREIFRRAELQGDGRERRGRERDQQRRDAAREERTKPGNAERPDPPFPTPQPGPGPARPRRARWWPAMVVTTEDASPGMLTRMAVVEPPYWAP